MSEYGQDQIRPEINTRTYERKGKGDPFSSHPPFGGFDKPTKSTFRKYDKGKDGKYHASSKKKEVAEKMSSYSMGTWKKKGSKWKKIYEFGKAPASKGPQKGADAGNHVDPNNWTKKDWPKHK